MKNIIAGCKSVGDIIERKINFERFLKINQIDLENKDFYSKEFYDYNIEQIDIVKNYPLDDVKSISNICKLRKNCNGVENYLNSKFLFVTTTQKTLQLSKEINTYGKFAIHLDLLDSVVN